MKVTNLISPFVLLGLFCLPLIFLLSKESFYLFVSYSTYVVPPIICGLFVLNRKINKGDLIEILILLAIGIISLAFTNGGVGSVLILFISVLMLQVISTTRFPKFCTSIISAIGCWMILFLFMKSFAAIENFAYYKDADINPNTMAYFIVYGFVYWFSFKDFSKFFNRILLIILSGLAFYGIYNFSSRGAALSLICFLLMNLIPFRFYKSRYFLIFILIFCGFCLLLPILYVYLYTNHINIEILNKQLYTGREGIWMRMFDAFKESTLCFVFGLGSKTELWVGHQLNVHNNYWAVLVNFGLFGFIAYYQFIIGKIKFLSKYMQEPVICRLVTGFISFAMIAGMLESTTFWMPVLIYVYFGLGFALSYSTTMDKTL